MYRGNLDLAVKGKISNFRDCHLIFLRLGWQHLNNENGIELFTGRKKPLPIPRFIFANQPPSQILEMAFAVQDAKRLYVSIMFLVEDVKRLNRSHGISANAPDGDTPLQPYDL